MVDGGGDGGRPGGGGGGSGGGGPPPFAVDVAEKIQIVQVGESVQLNCRARERAPVITRELNSNIEGTNLIMFHLKGSNPLRITWTRAGPVATLPNDGRHRDDGRGVLLITDVRATDAGTYVCRVTDGVFVLTDEARLDVVGEGGGGGREPPGGGGRPPGNTAFHRVRTFLTF